MAAAWHLTDAGAGSKGSLKYLCRFTLIIIVKIVLSEQWFLFCWSVFVPLQEFSSTSSSNSLLKTDISAHSDGSGGFGNIFYFALLCFWVTQRGKNSGQSLSIMAKYCNGGKDSTPGQEATLDILAENTALMFLFWVNLDCRDTWMTPRRHCRDMLCFHWMFWLSEWDCDSVS